MNHASARYAITRILDGAGFGPRALALALASSQHGLKGIPDAVRSTALTRSAAMAPDQCQVYAGPLNQATIPGERPDLCAQLCPVVIEHPAGTGGQLALLHALCALWPHATTDERPALRQRWLSGVTSRQAPADSTVSSVQLRAWQRELPTVYTDAPPSAASLKGVLSESKPQFAYKIMAEHLGSNTDLPTLSWVLGALAVQVLLHFRDPSGHTLSVLLGSSCAERQCAWSPPEHSATQLSQLSHELWWCRQRGQLPPVRSCLDTTSRPFPEAVASGDITGAQRAARSASKQPEQFWPQVWQLLAHCADQDDAHWARALSAVAAISYRTGENALAPDDAAVLGAVFADLVYRDDKVVAG